MGNFSKLAAVDWPKGQNPCDLNRLYPREREIALLVYARGCVTAREVEAAIGGLTNAAVRSMLNRLVRKGLITRQELKPPNPFVYAPALTSVATQEIAIRQYSDDFFGGSLKVIAAALADHYSTHESDTNIRRRPVLAIAQNVPALAQTSNGDDLAEEEPYPIATAA